MGLAIKVEIIAGTGIDEAVRGMIRLARLNGVMVVGKFNGVRLHVTSNDTPGEVVADYHRALRGVEYPECCAQLKK
jgi:hypothetical protein